MTALPDVLSLLNQQEPAVVVINSVEPTDAIARVTAELRSEAANVRIVVIHNAAHTSRDGEILADLCIHSVANMEDIVVALTAALENEVPATEPHEASEVLGGDVSE